MKNLFFILALAGAAALASPNAVFAAGGARGGVGHAMAMGRGYGPRVLPSYGGYPAFGVPYGPFWYGPGWGGYYYGYPYFLPQAADTGGLRLEITPKTAQVFVDGYYAGVVDDFNGHFHHLDMTSGGHSISVQQPGFQPLTFHVYVQPGHTTDYKAVLAPAAR